MYKITRGKLITNAYLAGIIDGEGSIFICRIHNKRSGNIWYRLELSCGMTSPEAIGLLRTFNPRLKQYIYIKGRKKGYKDVYQWKATGETGLRVIESLIPYMLVKKRQAKLAVEFQKWRSSLPNTGKKRTPNIIKKFEIYYQRMRALNGKRPQRLSEETAKADAIV